MGWLSTLLGSVMGAIPSILVAFQHIMKALGDLFDKLGQDKAQAVTQQAEELAIWVEQNHDKTIEWFNNMYPDLQSLLQYWAKLPEFLYVASNTQKDQKIDLHTAVTATQLCANVVKQGGV